MPNHEPKILLGDLMFPEGPRWHDGRLWFSDMQGNSRQPSASTPF